VTAPEPDANGLGAFSLVVADQICGAIAQASGQSASGATTLSALRHFLREPTLDELRLVLDLTPSGAVRLVDRLEAAGLVTRGPGADGRSRSVRLTRRGRAVADRVATARSAVLNRLVSALSDADRAALRRIVERMMAAVVADKDGGAWICRLCDTVACGRELGRCPAANAAVAKYGPEVFSP
jgi:DNA-binding MarR family transcriptional regulator